MLRKSPRRTPALLAANRANALKSTGPRTARGKQAVVLNRLDEGNRCPDFLTTISRATFREQLEFSRIYVALHYAFNAPEAGMDTVLRVAFRVWRAKHIVEADLPTAQFLADVREHRGRLPEPCKMQFSGNGRWVTVTVGVRQARGRTGCWPLPNIWDGKRPLHAQVLVRTSEGRMFRPGRGAIEPLGITRQGPAVGSQRPVAQNQVSGAPRLPEGSKTFKAGMLNILKMLAGYHVQSPNVKHK